MSTKRGHAAVLPRPTATDRMVRFGASSLDIFIYAFTVTTNWAEYMQTREDLLLEFMTKFEELGLSFAFPSQSIYVESLPPGAPAAMNRELPM